MENVKYHVEGDDLVIRINLKYRGEKSGSGKNTRVASTNGNISVPEFNNPNMKMGINIFTKE